MASKSDYFGLPYIVSVILAIIPVTAWVCGFITRFADGKIVAGIIRFDFRFHHRVDTRPHSHDCQQAHFAHPARVKGKENPLRRVFSLRCFLSRLYRANGDAAYA